jgi:hypothetical protein
MRKALVAIVLTSLILIALAEFCLGGVHKAKAVAVRSPLKDERKIHVLFRFDTPEMGIFPSDAFTVADDSQKTGLRVKLPLPDCKLHVSDCKDIALINVLDGFSLQPRVTVPFDGDIDPASVNSSNAFFVELGNADVDAPHGSENGASRVIGVNQLVWDRATRVLAAQSDEQLRQHTRYAFVLTKGVLDSAGAPVTAAEGLERFRSGASDWQASDLHLKAYRNELRDALARLQPWDLRGKGREPERVYDAERDRSARAHSRQAQTSESRAGKLSVGGWRQPHSLLAQRHSGHRLAATDQGQPAGFPALQAAVPRRNQTLPTA